jgi:hypothetical protein
MDSLQPHTFFYFRTDSVVGIADELTDFVD